MRALIKVTEYQNGTKLDTMGRPTIFVNVLAGSYPRSCKVINPTHAELIGLHAGYAATKEKEAHNGVFRVVVSEMPGINEYTTHDGKAGKSKNWNITIADENIRGSEELAVEQMLGDPNTIDDVVIGDEKATEKVEEEPATSN